MEGLIPVGQRVGVLSFFRFRGAPGELASSQWLPSALVFTCFFGGNTESLLIVVLGFRNKGLIFLCNSHQWLMDLGHIRVVEKFGNSVCAARNGYCTWPRYGWIHYLVAKHDSLGGMRS